jgi:hypothetical protein
MDHLFVRYLFFCRSSPKGWLDEGVNVSICVFWDWFFHRDAIEHNVQKEFKLTPYRLNDHGILVRANPGLSEALCPSGEPDQLAPPRLPPEE